MPNCDKTYSLTLAVHVYLGWHVFFLSTQDTTPFLSDRDIRQPAWLIHVCGMGDHQMADVDDTQVTYNGFYRV